MYSAKSPAAVDAVQRPATNLSQLHEVAEIVGLKMGL